MRLYKEAAFEESKGNLQAACDKLEQALTVSEEDYIIKSLAGTYERLERIPEAKETFTRYLDKFGDDFEILKKLSKYSIEEHDNVGALEFLERALAINSEDKDLWYHRGRRELTFAYEQGKESLRGQKYSSSAIKSFQNALRENITSRIDRYKNSRVYYNMSYAYYFLFDAKNAYDACWKAIEFNPEKI